MRSSKPEMPPLCAPAVVFVLGFVPVLCYGATPQSGRPFLKNMALTGALDKLGHAVDTKESCLTF